MDLHYKQEIKVGFLVILAMTVFVGGLMWLSGVPFVGGRQVTVPVVFSNVAGLSAGDPVWVSGLQVGFLVAFWATPTILERDRMDMVAANGDK